jgi:hypothetical protein
MRTGSIPFKFEISDIVARAQRQAKNRLGDISINLPFVSFSISPIDTERRVAREIVIRLRDRRVLSAWECCDNCIDRALESLQEMRRTLVDKQVELGSLQDGPLYLLTDIMAEGIRQFLTYEEMLRQRDHSDDHPRFGDFRRPQDVRQAYFDALEQLRGHLSRCLSQGAVIGGMSAPTEGLIKNYQGPWPVEAYSTQALPNDG